jgi:hypothetical protein
MEHLILTLALPSNIRPGLLNYKRSSLLLKELSTVSVSMAEAYSSGAPQSAPRLLVY